MKPGRRIAAPAAPRSDPDSRRHERFLRPALLVFGLALAIRLIHVWQLRRSPFFEVLLGDGHGYDEWARRIAAGDWIGSEVFYQAPLYPYFLGTIYATLGHSLVAVRVIQAVLGAGSCAFLALAAARLFSRTVGLTAGIALAIYAPAIFFDSLIQKSVLDLLFITLSIWLISRLVDSPGSWHAWLGTGLAMGGMSLTRENALVFIAVIVGWALLRPLTHASMGLRIRSIGALALGLAIVLLPVAIRNYAVGGGFYLTTSQFGPNFFIGNNPLADGTYMSLRFGRGAPEYERIDATELAEHARGRKLTPGEVSSYWTDRALSFVTGQPGAWLRLMGRKTLLLINRSEMLDTESQESYAEYSWPLRLGGWFGHFGLLAPLALIGAWLAWPDRRRLAIFYLMTVAYAASVLVFYVFARYRLPLVPLLMLFAVFALVTIASRAATLRAELSRLPRGRLAAAAAVLLVVTVAANWPVLSSTFMRAITENNLGTALQAEGRSADALAHFDRAIAIAPDYAPAYNNKGVTLRASGQLQAAIAAYERALATKGDYPDAHYNLANALLEAQQPAKAATHFEIALGSIPDSAGIRNNLGIALAAQGRPADALAAFRAAVAAEPESAIAHRNLGDLLADNGQTAEAIAMLTRAASLDPKDYAAHYNLASVLMQVGRFADAIAEYRIALQLQPRSVEARNNLGIALAQTGALDQAIAQFREALAIDPSFADAQRNLQMALQATNRR